MGDRLLLGVILRPRSVRHHRAGPLSAHTLRSCWVQHYPALPSTGYRGDAGQWATVQGVSDDPRDPRVYLRIAGEVRARIEAGEFDGEGKILLVRTLMQEHGVAY